ncbi:EamA family transporter [Patulibacter sp. NPDC049589]|uniref:EamA family transporter n=1 Tax=Patulibacter sp. NPDC049589 TaxID=3154731 RepID=UPI003438D4DA
MSAGAPPSPAAAGTTAPGGTVPSDVLMVLGAIGSVQISAAVATEMFDEVGPLGATLLRSVMASAVLLVLVRPRIRGLSRDAVLAVVPYGLVLGVMNTAFYLGIDRVPLGTAVAIEFLGPLGVGAWFARRTRDRVWVLLAALGVLALTRPWSADGADPVGVAWMLLAAGCWAAYIPLGARAARGLPGLQPVALGMAVGALVVLVPGLASGGGRLLHGHVLVIGAVAALAGSVIPYSLEQLALRRIAPGVFGVLMALEPGVAAAAGLLVLGQDLEPLSVLGLVLVVAAGVGITRAPSAPVGPVPSPVA